MSPVTYRNATAEDIAAIVAVLDGAGLPSREIESIIDGFIVVERDGAVVACGAIEVYEDTALVRSVAVSKEARGTGIGRELSQRLIAAALDRGCTDLYLFTGDAHTFWRRLGFTEITLTDWRLPARSSWQWQYINDNPEFAQRIGLHTMWMAA